MKAEVKTENGAASILIELRNGEITIKHGTDKAVLFQSIEVKPGTWSKLFNKIKEIIKEAQVY